MIIHQVKINGIKEPMGYDFPWVMVSYQVTDTKAKIQTWASIEISTKENFSCIEGKVEGRNLCSKGEKVSIPYLLVQDIMFA